MSDLSIEDEMIDTRDLVEYLDYFNDIREDEGEAAFNDAVKKESSVSNYEALKELDELVKDELSDYGYGETLINDSYFEDYCRQLCEDIGAVSPEFPVWIEIDWSSTAENLSVDYKEYHVGGETFWARIS